MQAAIGKLQSIIKMLAESLKIIQALQVRYPPETWLGGELSEIDMGLEYTMKRIDAFIAVLEREAAQ